MGRRLVFTDSHGGCKAMIQCLERCGFNGDEDQLFFLGDVVDGWGDIKESIDLLMGIKKLVYLLGNHDQWVMEYYMGKMTENGFTNEFASWQHHGGLATRESYGIGNTMYEHHFKFLANAEIYHITPDNKLFVHAGFDPTKPIETQDENSLIWNRNFARDCFNKHSNCYRVEISQYDEVYIGHTPTLFLDSNQDEPLIMGNVIMMDTGAAFEGCLCIMDIDTKEVWKSDKVKYLYPNQRGRNAMSWDDERKKLGI